MEKNLVSIKLTSDIISKRNRKFLLLLGVIQRLMIKTKRIYFKEILEGLKYLRHRNEFGKIKFNRKIRSSYEKKNESHRQHSIDNNHDKTINNALSDNHIRVKIFSYLYP